jgi:hypothetical protein
MKRKTKRIIVRLSVFCTVFFMLAAGFGFKYIRARDAGMMNQKINDERAYTSLCEYMISIGSLLRQINTSPPDMIHDLSARFSSITGGAKAILASLPFDKSGRERLQTFFSECDVYVYSLASSVTSDTITVNLNINIIAEYISYNDKITEKLIKAYDGTDKQSLEKKLSGLQIDTPPSYGEVSYDNKYVSSLYNITETQAKKIAHGYLGDYITLRRVETDKKFFRYASGSSFADILLSGGVLVRLSSGRVCDAEKIKLTVSEAKSCAVAFLKNENIKDVTFISAAVYAGRYEAEYAPAADDGVGRSIYIGVSLDTGKITYYDASDYYDLN